MKNKVINFIRDNYKVLIIVFLYLFFIYFWYFKNIITIDTEDALLHPTTYYYGWIGQNRFSLFLINKILSIFSFNILYRRLLTFIIFYISIIIIIKCSMKWLNIKDKKIYLLIILIFGSSPIFAEQFYFTLQSIPISFGLLLEAISLIFLDKYEKKHINYLIMFSIINIFNFGLYQAFIPLYITIIIIYLFTHYDETNKWKEIIKHIILFLINFCLYYVISYVLKKIIITNEIEYIDSLIRWKNLGIVSSILHIGFYFLNIILSKDYYHVLSFIILFIICLKLLIEKNYYFKIFLFTSLFLSVFLLTIITASDVVFRSQFSYVFVLCFIFLYYYKISKNKKLFYILIILCLIRQSFFTYSLLYYDNIRYKDDIKLAKYTYNMSKKYPNKKIIFVGAFHNNKNVKIKGESLGHSFASWDFMSDYGVNGRFKSFMKTQNINVKMGNKEDYNNLKQYYDHEHYPSKNGYQIKDDYVIINLY